MNAKVGVPILAAALALSGAMAFTAQAQTSRQPEGTVFECIKEQSSGNFTTVAKRGTRTSTPLIIWTTTLNSDAEGLYTPDRRCKAVSKRLTDLVATVGKGSLKNLLLDYKTVNNEVAICVYHTAQAGCSTRNVAFTLKPENRPLAAEIIAQLKEFSQKGSGSAIYESEDDSEVTPTAGVSLDAWSEQAFRFQSSADDVSGSSSPASSPSQDGF